MTQVPPHWRDKIVHATLAVGNTQFAGADVLPDQHERPRGFNMLLDVGNPSDVEGLFDAFAEGGVVQLPLAKTFWSESFGVLTDRFGITWEINCAQPVGPDRIVVDA
jgi:PhnB protein